MAYLALALKTGFSYICVINAYAGYLASHMPWEANCGQDSRFPSASCIHEIRTPVDGYPVANSAMCCFASSALLMLLVVFCHTMYF